MVLAAIAVGLIGLVARIQWAKSIPSRPESLPLNAVWAPAPPAPLDLIPRGYWLGCWLDTSRNVDRCILTDYRGNVEFVGDYSPLTGPAPVPESRLHIAPQDWPGLWEPTHDDLVPVARLQDGTVLVPTKYLSEMKARQRRGAK